MKWKVNFVILVEKFFMLLGKRESLEIASALKNNSFSIESSNDNESKVYL